MAADAVLTTADTDDDLVVYHQGRHGVTFTDGVIAVTHLPQQLAAFSIKRYESVIGLPQEQPAICIRKTTVDRVTAHYRDNPRILDRLVAPDNTSFILQVERKYLVGERSVDIQPAIANIERATFMTT